ncbi:MAG: ferritin-like domain-containing protein, partial [Myxococcales bacterium]|nr:ferritin-like domain-containing protein [Myxococcales bacterium]
MLNHERALRCRILGAIAIAFPACSEPDGGAGGAGGSLPEGCYEDEVGVCCVDPEPHCYTQQEIVDLTAELGGSASGGSTAAFECPALDHHYISDCEWLIGSPTFENGSCCYTYEGGSCCGRPFIVDGAQLVASTEARDDWSGAPAQPALLDEATRQHLAREWREDALLEHASIAAFSRFTLQLMALGAPRELIAASQQASLDEIAHAEACFAQAARFGGAPIGPGPLDVTGALESMSLPEIAALAVIEGCVGETVAASLASSALAVAVDTDAARALHRIASDEAEH